MSTLEHRKNVTASSYHHGSLKETLIKQGLILLETNQNTEFSMRELTRMIGVSANAVYRHFANKDELLTALAIYGFEQLLAEQATAMMNQPSTQEGFFKAGRQYINFAVQHPTLFRLMYGRFAQQHHNEQLKDLSKLAYNGMLYAVCHVLNVDPKSQSAQTYAIKSWSVVHGLSHLLIDGQFDHLAEVDKEQTIESVLSTAYSLK